MTEKELIAYIAEQLWAYQETHRGVGGQAIYPITQAHYDAARVSLTAIRNAGYSLVRSD